MSLQQLPQLLDLGSHAALGGAAHGRVLLHAVDNIEDLGDIAAKQGAGEAKRRGVSGEHWGWWLLYVLSACREGEGAEMEPFSKGKDLLQPCLCTWSAWQPLLVADQESALRQD